MEKLLSEEEIKEKQTLLNEEIDDCTQELCALYAIINKEEWVDLLNQRGESIGSMTRGVMRKQGMLHRATYLIVHNAQNQILVQKRTATKDYLPGYWDATAGGVVQYQEETLFSMKREAEEELGISDTPFVFHGEFYYSTGEQHIIGYLYSCISKGPFALQASEIEAVKWMSFDEINQQSDSFTPDSIYALKKWINRD